MEISNRHIDIFRQENIDILRFLDLWLRVSPKFEYERKSSNHTIFSVFQRHQTHVVCTNTFVLIIN